MSSKRSKLKKGVKRAWCKKKLRQLFTVLTRSNNARVETASKPLQLNKANVFYSAILLIFITVQQASAITPVMMVGPNTTDTMAKAEKACTFLCKLALTLNRFPQTKEGRTTMLWIGWMGASKLLSASSLVVVPSMSTAAIAIALLCSTAYGLETLVGADTFGGSEFLNYANKWCTKGFAAFSVGSILPKGKIDYAIKLLESLKSVG